MSKLIQEGKGAVKSFQLPNGWEALSSKNLGAGRQVDKYAPVQYPDIRFCSYLRSLPLSKTDAIAFENCLYSEFHRLSPEEISGLTGLFEAMSNDSTFSFEQAYTCYLNSRRVVRVEGTWLKTAEKTLAIFVDLKGNGQLVQQLYFVAKQSEFAQLLETAENILLSISWQLQV